MKKEIPFAIATFIFITLSAITYVYAVEESKKLITISEDKFDVTGDGKEDIITIKGVPYEEGTQFLEEIYLEIKASNGQLYKVELDDGYSPKIQFIDLNHDGVVDMFISIETGGSGGITNHHLYTLKDFTLLQLGVPDPLVINGQLQNDYKASITIEDTGQSYTFDLRNRAADYEKLGLYQDGMLSEPTELMIDPYSILKPIQVNANKQFGLMGIQAISGAYHADRIALVESTWLYEKGKWNLKNTKILEMKSKKQKKKK
ncbi:hypothetical protein KDN24_17615 [Bacillus sp. Bva_UNVM-123]|uniref:hypothetical protein n=1 Tax=Bacillus sp. Bva_UNVM-123 TaxID=2829798 RepID=UPI00391F9B2F